MSEFLKFAFEVLSQVVYLIDEEEKHRKDDYNKESNAAGKEVHDFSGIFEMAYVFTYDIAIGDDMGIGNSFVVITECCIASYVSHFLDLLDTVGIQCVFVVNDCVETDNVSLFQSGSITFLDKNQVAGTEGRCHGIGFYHQRCIAHDVGYVLVVSGCHCGKCIQRCHQYDHPQ